MTASIPNSEPEHRRFLLHLTEARYSPAIIDEVKRVMEAWEGATFRPFDILADVLRAASNRQLPANSVPFLNSKFKS